MYNSFTPDRWRIFKINNFHLSNQLYLSESSVHQNFAPTFLHIFFCVERNFDFPSQKSENPGFLRMAVGHARHQCYVKVGTPWNDILAHLLKYDLFFSKNQKADKKVPRIPPGACETPNKTNGASRKFASTPPDGWALCRPGAGFVQVLCTVYRAPFGHDPCTGPTCCTHGAHLVHTWCTHSAQ